MDGPLAPRKHAVLIENQQSDGLPLITALIFFPRNDPKCPDTFVITNCAHSILEPHFTFSVALKTKRFQVANPSLFVFNGSCSMTLKTQSQGQISKWLFVSSLRACCSGWVCTVVTLLPQGLVKNVLREWCRVSAPWGPWSLALYKFKVLEDFDLWGWIVLWYVFITLYHDRPLQKKHQ